MSTKSLGEIAYEAYADRLGLTAVWPAVAPAVRSAWLAAGTAVLDHLQVRLTDIPIPAPGTPMSPVEEPACPVVENPTAIGRPDAVPVVQLPPGAADLIRINCKDCGHPDSAHAQVNPRAGCLTGSEDANDGAGWFCACMLTRGQVRSGSTA